MTILGNMLPHMKEELLSHELSGLSRLATKASLLGRSKRDLTAKIVPVDDYGMSENVFN